MEKTAPENTKYSSKETILKIGRPGKAIYSLCKFYLRFLGGATLKWL